MVPAATVANMRQIHDRFDAGNSDETVAGGDKSQFG
jgi:hypothetical protein